MLIKKKLMQSCITGLFLLGILSIANAQPVLYDRGAAITYADRWSLSNNRDYYSYDSDCTNYASQCLRAGGCNLSADPQSYYDDCTEKTVQIYRDDKGMIVNVNQFNGWLRGHSSEPEYYSYVGKPSSSITWGDIIIFGSPNDYYTHTTIVRAGSGENVYLNAHTNFRYHQPYTFFFGFGTDQWTLMHCYHITSTGVATTIPVTETSYGSGCYFSPSPIESINGLPKN